MVSPGTPYFNPLPPYGGRLLQHLLCQPSHRISIHSLRMEGDVLQVVGQSTGHHFNPLPPYGGRPSCSHRTQFAGCHFNPLPPYGGRLLSAVFMTILSVFQSTPSVWRETDANQCGADDNVFQSTPSVWRETARERKVILSDIAFQSTPSVWRETAGQ